MNFVHLVEFIVARKEWEEGKDFKVDTAHSPVVHLVIIVPIRKKALWWPVPSGRDVLSEGRLRVDATAGTEVSQLDLIVFDQYVLSMKKK